MSALTDLPTAVYTRDEVARHNADGDCWIVVDSVVYDVSKFAKFHPGGKGVLLDYGGKEATKAFYAYHKADVLRRHGPKYAIGVIGGEQRPEPWRPGQLDGAPYAELAAWRGWKSPYFNESHERFQRHMRRWHDENVADEVWKWEEAGTPPTKAMIRRMGEEGILATRIGPGPHMRLPAALPGGVAPDQFDYFHEMIAHQEAARMGCPGWADGVSAGLTIGLPPVLNYGPEGLKQRVAKEVLSGDKRICLAISEPFAGSDVKILRCRAEKTPCGRFFVVDGVKKWITNGTDADYFVTAVRTGGKADSMQGISLLLIPRGEGVETKPIKTSYSAAAGTAYVEFEQCRVPVENLIGPEGDGFKCIMANFNHERWMICCIVAAQNRAVVAECWKWAMQREVFGKRLFDQPVIRAKLSHMSMEVESAQHTLESVTYQMCALPYKEQARLLAGPIALLKLQCTRAAHKVMDDAVQVFGGRAITRTGMGQIIERMQRAYKIQAVYGGSEEIMADLAAKQAAKFMPPTARL